MKCEVVRDPKYIDFHEIVEIIIADIDNYFNRLVHTCFVKADNGEGYFVTGTDIKVGDYISLDKDFNVYNNYTLDQIKKDKNLRIIEE